MVKPTPINPSTARSHRRRARLNETARAYGFDTWTQLETAILNRNVVLMFTDKKKNPGSTTMDTGKG